MHCRTHPSNSWELTACNCQDCLPALPVHLFTVTVRAVTRKHAGMAADAHASSHMQVRGPPLRPPSTASSCPAGWAWVGLIMHIKSGTTNFCPCELCNQHRRRIHMGDPWDHHRRRNITDGFPPGLSRPALLFCCSFALRPPV